MCSGEFRAKLNIILEDWVRKMETATSLFVTLALRAGRTREGDLRSGWEFHRELHLPGEDCAETTL